MLCAEPAKACEQLGWRPKVEFAELVAMMVESDLRLLSAGRQADDSWAANEQ